MDAFTTMFGAAFESAVAGVFTEVATITSGGVTADYDVHYEGPDALLMDGQVVSREHEIELLNPAHAPNLTEGDSVVIGSRNYVVRERPYDDRPGANGYYRKVKLTKV